MGEIRASQRPHDANVAPNSRLTNGEISRYSRQLLVPAVGVDGQVALLAASVLVVGAGGLGCAALPYLAGAGVGRLGIVDFDEVDVTNLHRQVMYREDEQGSRKAAAAAAHVAALNSRVAVEPHSEQLGAENALSLVRGYDLVVDASDNPNTRYILNEACVLAGKPLVSGSAIGVEGQLTVYNFRGGPCYRCVFPEPMAIEASRRCSDNGVLGPVVGTIGSLQAMEAIKVITGSPSVLSGTLLSCALDDATFYRVKLRPRRADCASCGGNRRGSAATVSSSADDAAAMAASVAFCESHGLTVCRRRPPPPRPLPQSVSCAEYAEVRRRREEHLLLDVRATVQFAICHLPGAISMPLATLAERLKEVEEAAGAAVGGGDAAGDAVVDRESTAPAGSSAAATLAAAAPAAGDAPPAESPGSGAPAFAEGTYAAAAGSAAAAEAAAAREEPDRAAGLTDALAAGGKTHGGGLPVYCLCRRGVDSAYAASLLTAAGFDHVYDIRGGLEEWSRSVDAAFPTY